MAHVFTDGSLYMAMAAMPSLMKSESQLWSVRKKSRAIEEERAKMDRVSFYKHLGKQSLGVAAVI